ncbi:MAG TPA: deoxyguanosinetriphosphate triphosphohydrolase [Dehalococcoidales bacterium]|nr:deoxyguanosinetriphosphate triphosphohydrolase [Dehalococcoidales bacterium]
MAIERLHIRQLTEQREELLSPNAVKSKNSRGREIPEEPDPVRTCFQRDSDRIIHSHSFRRLKHKTQAFIAPLGDHYVTRLTHTMEVQQIARTIARALNLNEDLTEAIALGHDLGHTPFGHVGEDVLNELFPDGFKHNEQSLRVVEKLEKDGEGLNLTWEVRDGIVRHSKSNKGIILGEGWGPVGTIEGEIVKISDAVAYINHDIEDAIRAGVITQKSLPQSAIKTLGERHSQRVNTMVCDIIESSWDVRVGDIIKKRPAIRMSQPVIEAAEELNSFLFKNVYDVQSARKETAKARGVLRFLYDYYVNNEAKLPPEYNRKSDTIQRRVVDYISGMTDQFALNKAKELKRKL